MQKTRYKVRLVTVCVEDEEVGEVCASKEVSLEPQKGIGPAEFRAFISQICRLAVEDLTVKF
jgi:hypothetical protein